MSTDQSPNSARLTYSLSRRPANTGATSRQPKDRVARLGKALRVEKISGGQRILRAFARKTGASVSSSMIVRPEQDRDPGSLSDRG